MKKLGLEFHILDPVLFEPFICHILAIFLCVACITVDGVCQTPPHCTHQFSCWAWSCWLTVMHPMINPVKTQTQWGHHHQLDPVHPLLHGPHSTAGRQHCQRQQQRKQEEWEQPEQQQQQQRADLRQHTGQHEWERNGCSRHEYDGQVRVDETIS